MCPERTAPEGQRDATYRDVAEAGMPAEGMGLIADLMASSARETAWMNEQTIEGQEREIARLRAENERLRRTLSAARGRVLALFADPGADIYDDFEVIR